jgi:hypothetical protein
MGRVPGGPRDPWDLGGDGPDGAPPGDLIEDGHRPSRLRTRWTALPRRTRVLVLALVAVLALGAGGLQVQRWAAEREQARRVELSASVGVSSLSTTPAGGQVSLFLVVRNAGVRPVWITSVEGSAGGLVLRTPDDVDLRVAPGGDAAVPVSARLTCAGYDGGEGLTAAVAVRRQDGGSVIRTVHPDPAAALLDVASTLCAVRPDLRDRELSGPVLGP